MNTSLLPAFMCNIASRVVWLRQAIEQDAELKKIAHKLTRYTASMQFETELLSGKMEQVQKVVDNIFQLPEPRELSATFSRAPGTDTLDFVSELRQILAKPGNGIEAAQRIEQWVHEVLVSHTEGENPTLKFIEKKEQNSDLFRIPPMPVCDGCFAPAHYTQIGEHKRLFRCSFCVGNLVEQWSELK